MIDMSPEPMCTPAKVIQSPAIDVKQMGFKLQGGQELGPRLLDTLFTLPWPQFSSH